MAMAISGAPPIGRCKSGLKLGGLQTGQIHPAEAPAAELRRGRRRGGWLGPIFGGPLLKARREEFLRGGREAGGARARATAADSVEEKAKSGELAERRSGSRFKCLTRVQTAFNQIVILEAPKTSSSRFAGCRVLLLDHSGNVHSVYNRESAWTSSYWDEFASLPAIIPPGPVAIFGLGGGTTARLLLQLWPSLKIDGFEIDEMARLHLGLSELEAPTSKGGCLTVHVEDAFSPSAAVEGGFAGIIVDLFSEGGVVEELHQGQTWLNLRSKLRLGGRLMINCGGSCVEKADVKSDVDDGTWTWVDGGAVKDATLAAMSAVFDGQCNWRKMNSEDADNCFALSGPLPDLQSWAAVLPEKLKEGVLAWRPFR